MKTLRAFALFVIVAFFATNLSATMTSQEETIPYDWSSHQKLQKHMTDAQLSAVGCHRASIAELGLDNVNWANYVGPHRARIMPFGGDVQLIVDKNNVPVAKWDCGNPVVPYKAAATAATTTTKSGSDIEAVIERIFTDLLQAGCTALQCYAQLQTCQQNYGSAGYSYGCGIIQRCRPQMYQEVCRQQSFCQPAPVTVNVTVVNRICKTIQCTPPANTGCPTVTTGGSGTITSSSIPSGVSIASNVDGTAGHAASQPINNKTPYAVTTGGLGVSSGGNQVTSVPQSAMTPAVAANTSAKAALKTTPAVKAVAPIAANTAAVTPASSNVATPIKGNRASKVSSVAALSVATEQVSSPKASTPAVKVPTANIVRASAPVSAPAIKPVVAAPIKVSAVPTQQVVAPPSTANALNTIRAQQVSVARSMPSVAPRGSTSFGTTSAPRVNITAAPKLNFSSMNGGGMKSGGGSRH